MPALHIVLDVEHDGFAAMRQAGLHGRDGDQSVAEGKLIHLGNDAHIELGALPHGMASGAASVAFCFELPDGKIVIAETSLALLLTAADALKARFGDPRV